jgi:UDP-N-acetylglucosamine 3-dehydrogenase
MVGTIYRAAVIGLGRIARLHTHGYRQIPEITVVAGADISDEARRTYAETYGVPALYADYRELLAREQPDIVSICTWPPLHAEMTVAAAEAGVKAIICEKPMTTHLADADRMLAACRAAGTFLLINHQRRFQAQHVKAKELLKSGVIGQLVEVHATVGGEIEGQAKTDILTSADHAIDLIRFYADDEPVAWVMGQIDRRERRERYGHPVEDAAIGYFRFQSGVRGFVECGDIARPGYCRCRLLGTLGRIEAMGDRPNTAQQVLLRAHLTSGWKEFPVAETNPFVEEVRELLRCLEHGGDHLLSGEQGRATLEIGLAIFESSRLHARIDLPLQQTSFPLQLMIGAGQV